MAIPDGAKNSHILPTGQWYAPSAVCQSMPENARVCQSLPEYARVCQSKSEYARICQSCPRYAQDMPTRIPCRYGQNMPSNPLIHSIIIIICDIIIYKRFSLGERTIGIQRYGRTLCNFWNRPNKRGPIRAIF